MPQWAYVQLYATPEEQWQLYQEQKSKWKNELIDEDHRRAEQQAQEEQLKKEVQKRVEAELPKLAEQAFTEMLRNLTKPK